MKGSDFGDQNTYRETGESRHRGQSVREADSFFLVFDNLKTIVVRVASSISVPVPISIPVSVAAFSVSTHHRGETPDTPGVGLVGSENRALSGVVVVIPALRSRLFVQAASALTIVALSVRRVAGSDMA